MLSNICWVLMSNSCRLDGQASLPSTWQPTTQGPWTICYDMANWQMNIWHRAQDSFIKSNSQKKKITAYHSLTDLL